MVNDLNHLMCVCTHPKAWYSASVDNTFHSVYMDIVLKTQRYKASTRRSVIIESSTTDHGHIQPELIIATRERLVLRMTEAYFNALWLASAESQALNRCFYRHVMLVLIIEYSLFY